MVSKSVGIHPAFVKAGEITRNTRRAVESKDWRGAKYSELCDFVEDTIANLGGSPAFPCNICADSSAAHYTAEIGDQTIVEQKTILKVDIGAQVDGYPSDTSVTLCYNDDLLDLVEATKSALAEALKAVRVGTKTSDIGRLVEAYAQRRGYLPISNLSGHSLDQYVVHAGSSVPNVWSPSPSTFHAGTVYAIEPFFTLQDGAGIVVEGKHKNIYSLITRKKTGDKKLDQFVEVIWNKCKTLPFAARWFLDQLGKTEIDNSLRSLQKLKIVRAYPELVEAKQRPVAQAEHTIAALSAGAMILT